MSTASFRLTAVFGLLLLGGCAGWRDKAPTADGLPAEDDGITAADFDPENIGKKVRRLWVGEPSKEISKQAFREGEELFREKKFAEARKRYQVAVDRAAEAALEEDAMFMVGECEFFSDRYPKAETAYEELLKKYSNSEYLDQINRRRYAIAQYWQATHKKDPHWWTTPNFTDKTRPLFDTAGRAVRAYEQVMISDARGALSDDAVMSVAEAMFEKRYYDDADFRYRMLITDYPRSKHQFNAHMMSLRSKMLKYQTQGVDYNGAVLDEAEETVDAMELQFPDQVGPHRDYLKKARKEIHALKQERDWKVAEFYAGTAHYGAAKKYYNKIVEKNPQSSFADQARQRLAQYKNEPDIPPHPLAWALRWPSFGAGESTAPPQTPADAALTQPQIATKPNATTPTTPVQR